MNAFMNVMHTTTCNCAACAPVPTLGIEMPYEEEKEEKKVTKTKKVRQKLIVGENDLATVAPKVAVMLSEKDKHFAFEVTAGSNRKLTFVCPKCKLEFTAKTCNVVCSVNNGNTGCPVCRGLKVVQGVNDLATKCPKAAAMLSKKDKHFAFEATTGSNKRATFVCPDCKLEFTEMICKVVDSVGKGNTGCGCTRGVKVTSGVNNLATTAPKVAAMLSEKDKHLAFEVTAGSGKKATFICPDCQREFTAKVYSVSRSVKNGNTGCPICRGYKIVPGINDLATVCPEVAAMLSSKDKHFATEVGVGSREKMTFVCQDCHQKFSAVIHDVVKAIKHNHTGCPVCKGLQVIPGVNDLKTLAPKAAAMLSDKDKYLATKVSIWSRDEATFICSDCKQEFTTQVSTVAMATLKNHTGCSVCKGYKVVTGINDLATKYPKVAAMWSSKNKHSASEVTAGSNEKAFFVCPDCHKEFVAVIRNVISSVEKEFTGCYDCKMRRVNTISKPECFVTRLEMAFAGENGILNPFFDAQCILGENSRLGLDFVDNIQKFCFEYNGFAWHSDDETIAKDRFKFEAAKKAGYTMIRVLEPGLEVLDPKYDIVMPEGFRDNGGKYDVKIMEEVGRKVIHLLEEIYGRKASPEIWALNNFKEFEIWYDANKKELEANAKKRGLKGKTAAKKAA